MPQATLAAAAEIGQEEQRCVTCQLLCCLCCCSRVAVRSCLCADLPLRAASAAGLSIPKLDDANWAGGERGAECTLILTEGDSAKALAVAGLSVLGRDRYGVFPLKGKMLNVRDAKHSTVMDNKVNQQC